MVLVATGMLLIVNSASSADEVIPMSQWAAEGQLADVQHAADPAWPIHSWTRLSPGMVAPSRASLAGKVVVILCFQHW